MPRNDNNIIIIIILLCNGERVRKIHKIKNNYKTEII